MKWTNIIALIFALVGLAGVWCLTMYHAVGQEEQLRMSKQ